MRQAFAPVGTRLRKAAATEDGGEGVLGFFTAPAVRGRGRRPLAARVRAFPSTHVLDLPRIRPSALASFFPQGRKSFPRLTSPPPLNSP